MLPELQLTEYQNTKYRCEYLMKNIDDPWGSEYLTSILNDDGDGNVQMSPEKLQKGEHFTKIHL